MLINRKMLKTDARAAMRESKGRVLGAGVVFLLILLLLEVLGMAVNGEFAALKEMYLSLAEEELTIPEIQTKAGSGLIIYALDAMIILLSVGFSMVALRGSRREEVSVGMLFDGFSMFWRSLAVYLLRYLLVLLWTMVYTIPVALLSALGPAGSVVGTLLCLPLLALPLRIWYVYSQAVNILIDNPKLNPLECLLRSKKMMQGHKWEACKLDLSFLGWILLCCVFPPILFWFWPWLGVTRARFYDVLLPLQKEEPSETPAADSSAEP